MGKIEDQEEAVEVEVAEVEVDEEPVEEGLIYIRLVHLITGLI